MVITSRVNTKRYVIYESLYTLCIVCRGPGEPKNDQRTRRTELTGEHRQSGIAQERNEIDGSRYGRDMEMFDESGQRETSRRYKRYTRVGETVGLGQR